MFRQIQSEFGTNSVVFWQLPPTISHLSVGDMMMNRAPSKLFVPGMVRVMVRRSFKMETHFEPAVFGRKLPSKDPAHPYKVGTYFVHAEMGYRGKIYFKSFIGKPLYKQRSSNPPSFLFVFQKLSILYRLYIEATFKISKNVAFLKLFIIFF